MAWRQSPGGSEQHLTLAAAAARTRTQRPGKHLAVHASELVVKPDFQILRRYRRPLLLRLEHTHRPALEDYVHRATRLGSSRSLNLRIGIRPLLGCNRPTRPAIRMEFSVHTDQRNAENASCSVPYTFIKLLKPLVSRTSLTGPLALQILSSPRFPCNNLAPRRITRRPALLTYSSSARLSRTRLC